MLGSLQSEALLGFRHDAERDRTVLSHRRAGGLFHVSKPYWDGTVLGAQLVNPTAGIFSGDEMKLRVRLEERARVALTSPSATRFYAMDVGKACLRQHFSVGAGGWLEYRPDWVIPQSGSEVEQVTEIEVADGAEMVFFDRLAPGRVASGESYRYRRYTTSMAIRCGGSLVARERMVLEPDAGGWPLSVPGWDVTFFGAAWLAGPQMAEGREVLAGLERELSREGVLCGVTQLQDNLAVVRVLTARGLLLKTALADARRALMPLFPLLAGGRRTL